jgi:hypothetical protein
MTLWHWLARLLTTINAECVCYTVSTSSITWPSHCSMNSIWLRVHHVLPWLTALNMNFSTSLITLPVAFDTPLQHRSVRWNARSTFSASHVDVTRAWNSLPPTVTPISFSVKTKLSFFYLRFSLTITKLLISCCLCNSRTKSQACYYYISLFIEL